MKKLIEMKTIEKDGHHIFTYENGIKKPIPDDGVVFCYLAEETEKGRMLKATDFPDRAGAIDGRFVVTDEVEEEQGKPRIKGKNYDVWGIGEDETERKPKKNRTETETEPTRTHTAKTPNLM